MSKQMRIIIILSVILFLAFPSSAEFISQGVSNTTSTLSIEQTPAPTHTRYSSGGGGGGYYPSKSTPSTPTLIETASPIVTAIPEPETISPETTLQEIPINVTATQSPPSPKFPIYVLALALILVAIYLHVKRNRKA